MQNRTIKRLFAAYIIITTCTAQIPVYAATPQEELIIKGVNKASKLLESAIDRSYEIAEKNLKKKIVDDKLDYYFTMESYHNQQNPYKDAEYVNIISAYMVSKEYTNTLKISDFYSLPFVQIEVEQKTLDEYIPITIDKYIQYEDYFILDGTQLIEQPSTITNYKMVEDGKYVEDGTKEIELTKKLTTYGNVSVKGLTAEDILGIYGLSDDKEAVDAYKQKSTKISNIINSKQISNSLFLKFQSTIEDQQAVEIISKLNSSKIDTSRKTICSVAASLIGKVPYQWGGKSTKAGYDTSWWTLNTEGEQKGLDCSGFVQWCFRTAGYDNNVYDKLLSTTQILSSCDTITQEELQPGDIGLLHTAADNDTINHTGIYAGNGNWIHCSSGAGTVVLEQTDMFKVYKRMPVTDDTPNYGIKNSDSTYNKQCEYSEEDIILLAKLICNEADGEGLNGWIGVAEVVKNRLASDIFPDTIYDIIYQKTQFSDNDKIEGREPSEEQIKVAREVLAGNMTVFDNPDVLFFRNCGGSTDDWGKYKYYTDINNHTFYTYSQT